jgi:hypothetical protein
MESGVLQAQNTAFFVELDRRIFVLQGGLNPLYGGSARRVELVLCHRQASFLHIPSTRRINTMKLALLALAVGSAAAFAPAQSGKVRCHLALSLCTTQKYLE